MQICDGTQTFVSCMKVRCATCPPTIPTHTFTFHFITGLTTSLLTTTTFRDTVVLVLHVCFTFTFSKKREIFIWHEEHKAEVAPVTLCTRVNTKSTCGPASNFKCMGIGIEFDTNLRRGLNCFHYSKQQTQSNASINSELCF